MHIEKPIAVHLSLVGLADKDMMILQDMIIITALCSLKPQ